MDKIMNGNVVIPEDFNIDLGIEDLSMAIWGHTDARDSMDDSEIIGLAARKITILRTMLVASGFNENMLNAIMES